MRGASARWVMAFSDLIRSKASWINAPSLSPEPYGRAVVRLVSATCFAL